MLKDSLEYVPKSTATEESIKQLYLGSEPSNKTGIVSQIRKQSQTLPPTLK